MYSATATVITHMPGVRFDLFKYQVDDDSVKKCSISCIDGATIVSEIDFENMPSEIAISKKARDIHRCAVLRLCSEYGDVISEPKISLSNVVDHGSDDDVMVITATAALASASGLKATLTVGRSAETIKALVEPAYTKRDMWLNFLSQVRTSGSPIVEFLGCYMILASHHSDQQKTIDSFIKNEEPQVPFLMRKHSIKDYEINESIYTRLRNELMHMLDFQSPREPELIYNDIAMYLPGLVRLAKIQISLLD